MSKVTEGVKQFFGSSNKPESTEVCTEVAPEVTQEHVRPVEHTEAIEAVDRERHVHHHQHRVQPVEDKRTLDTQHVHTTAPVIERERKADMAPEHQAKLHEMRTQHKDVTQVGETERSQVHAGRVEQEHEHHHIHETIQPVIQRETIQPTTVHHTIGVHEKIHDAPIVHESTTLPTLSHADFLKQKAADVPHTHADAGHQHAVFEGAPRVGGAKDTTA